MVLLLFELERSVLSFCLSRVALRSKLSVLAFPPPFVARREKVFLALPGTTPKTLVSASASFFFSPKRLLLVKQKLPSRTSFIHEQPLQKESWGEISADDHVGSAQKVRRTPRREQSMQRLQRYVWYGSGVSRHLADSIRRPFLKSPARSSAVFLVIAFLLVSAFLSTRLLDSSSSSVSTSLPFPPPPSLSLSLLRSSWFPRRFSSFF